MIIIYSSANMPDNNRFTLYANSIDFNDDNAIGWTYK